MKVVIQISDVPKVADVIDFKKAPKINFFATDKFELRYETIPGAYDTCILPLSHCRHVEVSFYFLF